MSSGDNVAPASVNSERGEFTLVLDGETFGLRPSYEALQAIEEETGKGIVDLARACIGGTATMREVSMIAGECVRAWGREKNRTSAIGAQNARIGQLIMTSEDGLLGTMPMLAALLTMAIRGGITASGELKAATTTSQTTG